jgi:hypothetical protein
MDTKQKYTLAWTFITIALLIVIFNWINYLPLKECFDIYGPKTIDNGSSQTNHTINLPINTDYTCNNFCGPPSRCSFTGNQCSTDIDCPGCNPYANKKQEELKNPHIRDYVRGENDAGKLTSGMTPEYSVLTTDIGTDAKLYGDKLGIAPQYDYGVNIWRKQFDEGQQFFDKRYYNGSQPYTPIYPQRMTLSGQFVDNGPLASNAYL